jgi:citronellol/citronellal dehydrogenase
MLRQERRCDSRALLSFSPAMEPVLHKKTLFVTGASRGIGLAIALRAAKDGANVAIVAKTGEPHPRLPGTIYTAAEAVRKAGGQPLPIATDIRMEQQVANAVEQTVHRFGGIDILVNNASAIQLSSTLDIDLKRFDLMYQINTRGTFLCSKLCLPFLQKAASAHVLTMAPPIALEPKWFDRHVAYTVSKYAMALITFGLAAECRAHRIAFNCLWPKTVIQTAALAMIPGIDVNRCRTPDIVADAAYAILRKDPALFSGNFCIDEDILRAEGVSDFDRYAVDQSRVPLPDLFIE